MANFTDLLGSLVQNGMSQSGRSRVTNALEKGSGSSLTDLIGGLGQMMGGGQTGAGGLGGMLGDVLSGGSSGKSSALGSLGALAGAILGGGNRANRGSIGGGTLAMLASLAFKALQNSGQQPSQAPRALFEAETPEEMQAREDDATIVIKAMINAAKADGRIDEGEVEKIIGKLDDDGLTQAEKDFFMSETAKPFDLSRVVASAGGQADLAAQIYAASLLAIEVDTVAEQQYMQNLAQGLGLPPQATSYIEATLGLQSN